MTYKIREAAEALVKHLQAVTYLNATGSPATVTHVFKNLVDALEPVDSPVQAKLRAMRYDALAASYPGDPVLTLKALIGATNRFSQKEYMDCKDVINLAAQEGDITPGIASDLRVDLLGWGEE